MRAVFIILIIAASSLVAQAKKSYGEELLSLLHKQKNLQNHSKQQEIHYDSYVFSIQWGSKFAY